MSGKSRKEDENKHSKTNKERREEQRVKKVMAQQSIPTNNSPKTQQNKGSLSKNRGAGAASRKNRNPSCVLDRAEHWTKNHNYSIHGKFSV